MSASRQPSTIPGVLSDPPRLAAAQRSRPQSSGLGMGEGIVIGLAGAVTAADFAWPLRAVLSPALLLLLTGIVAPWCYLVVRAQRGSASQHTVAAWAFRIIALGLSFGFLGAKWWLLLRVVGNEPERYVGSSQS